MRSGSIDRNIHEDRLVRRIQARMALGMHDAVVRLPSVGLCRLFAASNPSPHVFIALGVTEEQALPRWREASTRSLNESEW